jgi:cytochrome c biogenesis protein CcmG, thiol:disulfide interchange protein DsbE
VTRRALVPLGVIAVIAVVVAGALLSGSAGKTTHPAPPLPGEHLAGPGTSLASLRGRPAFVVFWASWCEPCHQEAAQIERYATAPGARATVVGIDFDDALDSARSFLARYHWTFANVRDANGTLGGAWGLLGLPTTVLLDSRGRIVAHFTGVQSVGSLTRAAETVST